ncbi:MAG: D-tyrosyl-tRNA(Tyr) deacylase [Thelocarpon superellum]|nr:MAG: D-tyrosyl-tRNA(Tyr) deacylase [Thelocarpon superellum]
MKAILQRVLSASVTVDQLLVSSIGKGILVFAAVAPGDTVKEAEAMAAKILKMRIWDGEDGSRWKQNVQDVHGEVLCGPQAKALYDHLVSKIREGYMVERVQDGVFQAMMEVGLVNDGPVTLELSTAPRQEPQGS